MSTKFVVKIDFGEFLYFYNGATHSILNLKLHVALLKSQIPFCPQPVPIFHREPVPK